MMGEYNYENVFACPSITLKRAFFRFSVNTTPRRSSPLSVTAHNADDDGRGGVGIAANRKKAYEYGRRHDVGKFIIRPSHFGSHP